MSEVSTDRSQARSKATDILAFCIVASIIVALGILVAVGISRAETQGPSDFEQAQAAGPPPEPEKPAKVIHRPKRLTALGKHEATMFMRDIARISSGMAADVVHAQAELQKLDDSGFLDDALRQSAKTAAYSAWFVASRESPPDVPDDVPQKLADSLDRVRTSVILSLGAAEKAEYAVYESLDNDDIGKAQEAMRALKEAAERGQQVQATLRNEFGGGD
jgi:hypothetical protein